MEPAALIFFFFLFFSFFIGFYNIHLHIKRIPIELCQKVVHMKYFFKIYVVRNNVRGEYISP